MSLHAPGRLDHFLHGLLTQLAESEKVALGMEKHGVQTMTLVLDSDCQNIILKHSIYSH